MKEDVEHMAHAEKQSNHEEPLFSERSMMLLEKINDGCGLLIEKVLEISKKLDDFKAELEEGIKRSCNHLDSAVKSPLERD